VPQQSNVPTFANRWQIWATSPKEGLDVGNRQILGHERINRVVRIIRLIGAVFCFSQDTAAWLPPEGMSKYRVCHQAVDGS
jgi:hypothetical protein